MKCFKDGVPISGTYDTIINPDGNIQYYWSIAPSARTGTSPVFTDTEEKVGQHVMTNNDYQYGLKFYAVTDQYSVTSQISIFSSVIAFYTGFVLIVGTTLGNVFKDYTVKLWLTEVPNCDKLLRICDGITAAQVEGDLIKEER